MNDLGIVRPSGAHLHAPGPLGRLRRAWTQSLRFRLLWLGLMPLLLAFPIVLVAVGLVGGTQLNHLIDSQLTSNLSGAQNYLRVFHTDLQTSVAELVKNERLEQLVQQRASRSEINRGLHATIRGSGFDFLLMVNAEGQVIGSSSGSDGSLKVPRSSVIEQAQVGVATSGFEQFTVPEVTALSPALAQRLLSQGGSQQGVASANGGGTPRTATLVLAAAHLPLSVTAQDVVLVGGVLINENTALIEHLREIIYPTGKLPYESEGFAGIFAGQQRIVSSRLKTFDSRALALDASLIPSEKSPGLASTLMGKQRIGQDAFALAVSPIRDGEDNTIAYLAVGFPVGPVQNTAWLLLATLAGFLGLIMLIVSIIFLNAGHHIVAQIKNIAVAMKDFRDGNRAAQVQGIAKEDELGLLGHYVNDLLSIIATQEIELKQRALHDALTGLANRQNFTERMTLALASSDRTGLHGALLMLDLDNFKPLNDTAGHAAGDQLLIEVGRRLKAVLREVDTVARFGGDEFLVLLESLPTDAQDAQSRALDVAEKIRAAIDVPFIIRNQGQDEDAFIAHHCTASIGVALFLGKRVSQAHVLNMADAAMYAAKSSGRNRVCLYLASAGMPVEVACRPSA